jgi:UDP-N-acetylglucosamine--N-acetylmuramyl-(pentapeptide) pyrophosphoryl-undecaprenol N-acetylglucosamine transferase
MSVSIMNSKRDDAAMKNKMVQIRWYVGGLSAGHIMPLRAYAQQDRAKDQVLARFVVGPTSLDRTLMQAAPEIDGYICVRSCGLRFKGYRGYAMLMWHALCDIMQLAWRWYTDRPAQIITTGGGVALPALIIAACTRTPVRIYELNAIPGRMIAWCSWLGWPVHVVFAQALDRLPLRTHGKIVAYPLYTRARSYILTKEQAYRRYGLDPHCLTIVVLGGSQGSQWLNRQIPELIAQASYRLGLAVQVVHQTGNDRVATEQGHARHNISAHVLEFEPDTDWLYLIADMVICRAGSGTLHEVGLRDIPTVVIPLPEQVTDHQVANAQAWCAQDPARRRWCNQHDLAEKQVRIMCQMLALHAR